MTKKRKLVKTYVIIPNDFEFSVQYCETYQDALAMVEFFKGEALISEQEQYEDIIERKNLKTARYGYRL